MLCELRIRDVAVIDDLALTFGPGLNVITGETGAGKSIILQALVLLCGARGSVEVIRSGAAEATIEALFECPALPESLRDGLGLDGDAIVVRRHLARSGKSRAYVNGAPATLAMLAQLGEWLVHIYGQHDQALLLRPASQLELLDRFAERTQERERMRDAYEAYRAAQERLAAHQTAAATAAERRELLEFQVAELRDSAPDAGEDAALRAERELLRHAERVQAVCRGGEALLYSGDAAMTAALARLASQLYELTTVAPALASAAELIDAGRVQLEEAALQLRAAAERFHADPERLDAVEARLQLLARLARKHGVTPDELPERNAALAAELARLETESVEAAALADEVTARRDAALALAAALSADRRKAATALAKAMGAELAALGMPGARFQVRQNSPERPAAEALGPTGIDALEFLLSANPGEEPRPLARVASGGELSRIMLALKALTAAVGETPILIFDEVDAGIGGTVADAVARRLKALAHNRQVLCITHLAQIAAHADHHYAVEKRLHAGRTVTAARALAADERIAEVSRMLGGIAAPAEAERYARRLLAEARRAS